MRLNAHGLLPTLTRLSAPWAQIKASLRRTAVMSIVRKFQGTAIRAAINALTAEEATGYFRDCGLVPDDFAAANVNESAEERRSRLLLLLLLFLG